jgi:FKBP-type peptidyl-prolyl cis-trans isomerase FklB
MKSYLITALASALCLSATQAADKLNLDDAKQRISYCIGADIGSNFKKQQIEVDTTTLAKGMADSLAGKTELTEEQMSETMNKFRTEMMGKAQGRAKEEGEKNQKAGDEFMAANGKKEGVKTTATGLQYKVTKSGTGKSPTDTDTVKVHYHGTLLDGTVFDSSVQRGEPITFPVGGVIPGWTEALKLMKVGDKWTLYIPGKLAYGARGAGGKIGPNATLIFDVELLGIEAPGAAPGGK